MGCDQPIQHLSDRRRVNLDDLDAVGETAQAGPEVDFNHGPLP